MTSPLIRARSWAWALAVVPFLAVAPAAAASTTTPVSLSGTVVQVATETSTHDGSSDEDHDGTATLVRGADGSFTTLDDSRLAALSTGSSVALQLSGSGDVLSVGSTRRATTLSTATGAQTVRIAMIVPAGVTQDAKPFTTDQVRTALSRASQYWGTQTGGQVSFTATTVEGWTQSTKTCADFGGLWSEAAASTGFTGAAGEHLVVVVPKNAYTSGACSAYGMGSVGNDVSSAGYVYVADVESSLWAHELGHNMGLGHSNSLSSATASDVAWNGSSYPGATRVSYGNVWDVMSYSGSTIGHGNVGIAEQYRLGLLPAGIRTVSTTGSYTVAALPNAADGQVHGLRIVDPANGTSYFVELRGDSTGDDLVASDGRKPAKGVLVTKEDAAETHGTIALDGTPTGNAASDVNFTVAQGSTLHAASGALHVTVTAVNGKQATVTVTFGAAPTTPVTTTPVTAPVTTPTTTPVTTGAATSRSYSVDGVSRVVAGPILQRYLALDAQSGALGWPTSDQISVKDGGTVQRFQGGLVYWTAATGAQVVKGAILGTWGQQGWENSALGFPTSEEIPVRDGGVVQRFQNGLFYWTAATGAHEVRGSILSRYAGMGWENSALGFPTTGEIAVRGGVVQWFTGGAAYWSPATGAQVVKGAILGEWARRGYEGSALGYPVGAEYPVVGGMRQDFQGGSLTWTAGTGAVA